jgi:hypothetical protein
MDNFGDFFCNIAERLAGILPETPVALKLQTLAEALANNFPIIGPYIFYRVIRDISAVLSLVVAWKFFVAAPAKF